MIVIAGSSHTQLAINIAHKLSAELVIANTQRFADQELKVRIDKDIRGREVIILQSTCNPANDHLMELLLLADAAKRAGSSRITVVTPYLGYSRQNKNSHLHEPTSASLIAKLIEVAGVDCIAAVDLHSENLIDFFTIELRNINPLPLFLPFFLPIYDYVIVSPDAGSIARAAKFAEQSNEPLAIIDKSRNHNGECVMSKITGNSVLNKNCIIVDDIVDTGTTICNAAALLKTHGANSVAACVTHGVFSSGAMDKIKHARFEKFYVTDTIYNNQLPPYITLVSIAGLIANSLLK